MPIATPTSKYRIHHAALWVLASSAAACGGMSDMGENEREESPRAELTLDEPADAEEGARRTSGAEPEADSDTATEADATEPTAEDPMLTARPMQAEPAEPEAQPGPSEPAAESDLDETLVEETVVVQPSAAEPEAENGAEMDSEDAPAEPAAEPEFALEVVDDLSVLVIFDNSGSMDTYWDGQSRWAIANQALNDALAPVATSLKVAAIRFPITGECAVPDFVDEVHFGWQLAGEFLEEWTASSVLPTGGTPMGQAFLAADAAIAQASERGLLEDRFNVIVLTDGEPNCETDPALLTELPARWAERGVKTHVLGLPGSDTATQLLNDIAAAGGTGEFVALSNVAPEQLTHEVTALAR